MQESGVRSGVLCDSDSQISLRYFDKVSNPKSIHGIYPYRGKMSALDAAHVISQLSTSAVLLDPFCGTGTIIYEAQTRGMRTIGVDNNPLACVIARGKTEPVETQSMFDNLSSAFTGAKSLGDSQQGRRSGDAKCVRQIGAVPIANLSDVHVLHGARPRHAARDWGRLCNGRRVSRK